MIRVLVPAHIQTLANTDREITLVEDLTTISQVLDALDERYPQLSGTLRDRATGLRRPFIRFFACEEDLSHDPLDAPLPPEVTSGAEPLVIVGAMAGG